MRPTICVYSKPGCGICKAAKDKIARMGFEYVEEDITPYMDAHPRWRHDNSVAIRAALAMEDEHLPLISVDGEWLSYPVAMLALKNMRKQQEVNKP